MHVVGVLGIVGRFCNVVQGLWVLVREEREESDWPIAT